MVKLAKGRPIEWPFRMQLAWVHLSLNGEVATMVLMTEKDESISLGPADAEHEDRIPAEGQFDQASLIALFRFLTRQPPPGHDFKSCPICKRYGITNI